jgi:hypothetical protein
MPPLAHKGPKDIFPRAGSLKAGAWVRGCVAGCTICNHAAAHGLAAPVFPLPRQTRVGRALTAPAARQRARPGHLHSLTVPERSFFPHAGSVSKQRACERARHLHTRSARRDEAPGLLQVEGAPAARENAKALPRRARWRGDPQTAATPSGCSAWGARSACRPAAAPRLQRARACRPPQACRSPRACRSAGICSACAPAALARLPSALQCLQRPRRPSAHAAPAAQGGTEPPCLHSPPNGRRRKPHAAMNAFSVLPGRPLIHAAPCLA